MTGRRSMAGWEQRLSRALQFQPGHVGGRIASAQPVKRNGGMLRRPAVGAVTSLPAASSVTLRPDAIADYDDQPVSYQGGGGQNTLNDQSDSTFLRLDYTITPTVDFFGTPVATFAATDLGTWSTVTACALTVRARSLSNTGSNKIGFNVAGDILPGGSWDPYYTDSDEVDDGGGWVPGGSWVDYTYSLVNDPSNPLYSTITPTVAAVEAGEIQILITPAISTSAAMQLDVADVWLTLTGS